MANLRDLTGQIFFDLTVVRRAANKRGGGARWDCRCLCGGVCTVASTDLIQGNSKSCGCRRRRKGEDHPLYKGGTGFGSRLYCKSVLANSRRAATKRRHVGIAATVDELVDYIAGHNQCCDACGSPNKNEKINLSVDHDHDTGEIRGLLCLRCNRIAVEHQRVEQVRSYIQRNANG